MSPDPLHPFLFLSFYRSAYPNIWRSRPFYRRKLYFIMKSSLSPLLLALLLSACGPDQPATDTVTPPPPPSEPAEAPVRASVPPPPAEPSPTPAAYGRSSAAAAAPVTLRADAAAEGTGWLDFHRRHGAPALSWTDLRAIDTATVAEFPVIEYRPAEGFYELAIPDASDRRRIDLYGYEAELRTRRGKTERVGSPDSAVLLIEGDLVRQLLFCGTPCTYESAYWSGPEEVTVLGKVITNDGSAFHPHAWRIDLARQRVVSYRADTRLDVEGDFIGSRL